MIIEIDNFIKYVLDFNSNHSLNRIDISINEWRYFGSEDDKYVWNHKSS